jgi:hypothetical protein
MPALWRSALAQGVSPRGGQEAASGRGPLLLQRIDDVLYGVDPISLVIVDRHRVSGVLVRVNANQPSPPMDYSHFVADCQGRMPVALLARAASPLDLTAQGASARARVQATADAVAGGAAQFVDSRMLDGTRSLAEFACAATQRPAQAAQIAMALLDNGGPRDMRAALCDLRPDGAYVTREDVTVRFSDSEKVVAVNNQWLSSGQVTDAEISFGSGSAKWRIDRNSAEASLVDANGKRLFAGSCIAKPHR